MKKAMAGIALVFIAFVAMLSMTSSTASAATDLPWSNDMNQESYWESYFATNGRTVECTKYENHSGWIPAEYDAAVTKKGSDVVRVYADLTQTGAFQATHPQGEPPMSWVMKCKFKPVTPPTTEPPPPSTTTPPPTTTVVVPPSTTVVVPPSTTVAPPTTSIAPTTTVVNPTTTVGDTTPSSTFPDDTPPVTSIDVCEQPGAICGPATVIATPPTTVNCDLYVPQQECVPATTAVVTTTAVVDYDCSDYATQADAQYVLGAVPGDPYGLDDDSDGIACEMAVVGGSLPVTGAGERIALTLKIAIPLLLVGAALLAVKRTNFKQDPLS